MKEKILTISVATYNLGSMIEDNLQSFIKSESIDNIEVLVIDDGSTDNTIELAQKYQNNYPNSIKIIRQKNAGPGSTVNTGLKNATGKYFKMIDGDDWVNTEALDSLINNLKKIDEVDAVITNDVVYSDLDKQIKKKIKFNYQPNKIFQDLSIKYPIIGMHSILFRTEILRTNNVTLDNGFYTDVEYLIYPLPFIKNIIYYDIDLYMYRVGREGQSVSYNSLKKNIDMFDLVLENLTSYYEKNKEISREATKTFIVKRIANMVMTKITLIMAFEERKMVRKLVKEYLYELKNKNFDIYAMCKKNYMVKLLQYSNYYFTLIYAVFIKNKLKSNNKE